MQRTRGSPGSGESNEELDDPLEFPAAVLCARCRRPDCSGCEPAVEAPAETPSPTPWETEGGSVGSLWSTAALVTVEGRVFFGGVHAGSLTRAFTFALASELLAVGSLLAAWLAFMLGAFPTALDALVELAPSASIAAGAAALTVVIIASLMVVLHAVWATCLELGVRLSGREMQLGHALRYAMYSCGWDLVTSPFGFCAGVVTGGPRRALGELRQAVAIPGEATRAYLRVARGMPHLAARRAIWLAAGMTGGLVLVLSGAVLGVIVAASL